MRISDWSSDVCSSDLGGKSVAVIGTGASAIQFVPEIVPKVKALSLFQRSGAWVVPKADRPFKRFEQTLFDKLRSEEHTSELQSLMRISYAVFCLKKKTDKHNKTYKKGIIDNTKQRT